jgi:hypothetical protein
MSLNIVSLASIVPPIYSFVSLYNLEIISDRINTSMYVALFLILSSSHKV